MEDFIDSTQAEPAFETIDLVIRFFFNLLIVFGLTRGLYYPRSRRRDYLFVFIIISIAIFLMVNLLGALKIKVGFALGLFAIFGIIRYRTEQMPVREMSYLFVIIALSVINGLSFNLTVSQTLAANLLLLGATWVTELELGLADVRTKLIAYDDISKIHASRRDELIADLHRRTGLDITRAEVGHIDFVRDLAMVRIYYIANHDSPNDSEIESLTKLPNEI